MSNIMIGHASTRANAAMVAIGTPNHSAPTTAMAEAIAYCPYLRFLIADLLGPSGTCPHVDATTRYPWGVMAGGPYQRAKGPDQPKRPARTARKRGGRGALACLEFERIARHRRLGRWAASASSSPPQWWRPSGSSQCPPTDR